jgi:hypothetical protein
MIKYQHYFKWSYCFVALRHAAKCSVYVQSYQLCRQGIRECSNKQNKKTKKLRGPSPRANYTDRATRLSAKLVPTFVDRGCHVISVTDPCGRILGFLDQSHYFFFQVAPQLYSRGWVDHVSDPLLLRKSGSAGNRTRTSGSIARNSDH